MSTANNQMLCLYLLIWRPRQQTMCFAYTITKWSFSETREEKTKKRAQTHNNLHLISKNTSLLVTVPWGLVARHVYWPCVDFAIPCSTNVWFATMMPRDENSCWSYICHEMERKINYTNVMRLLRKQCSLFESCLHLCILVFHLIHII